MCQTLCHLFLVFLIFLLGSGAQVCDWLQSFKMDFSQLCCVSMVCSHILTLQLTLFCFLQATWSDKKSRQLRRRRRRGVVLILGDSNFGNKVWKEHPFLSSSGEWNRARVGRCLVRRVIRRLSNCFERSVKTVCWVIELIK